MTTKEFSLQKSNLNYDIEKLVNDFVSKCEKHNLTIAEVAISVCPAEPITLHYFNVSIDLTV